MVTAPDGWYITGTFLALLLVRRNTFEGWPYREVTFIFSIFEQPVRQHGSCRGVKREAAKTIGPVKQDSFMYHVPGPSGRYRQQRPFAR